MMKSLYPEIEAYKVHHIAVEKPHVLYVEEAGNPQGLPVLIAHGGPGMGADESYRRFFDPKKYRMIIFDQRGCGRSTPAPCIENNSTVATIADIELIREQLGIEKWAYFGGSWASRLGIAYAQTHPERLIAIILRGVYFADQEAIEWFYGTQGTAQMSPDYYQDLQALTPGLSGFELVQAYYELLTGTDESLKQQAARAYTEWTVRSCSLEVNQALLQGWAHDPHTSLCFALNSTHYILHDDYLKNHPPLQNMQAMQNIPGIIVQGRYDMICRAYDAWRLHQAWPASRLELVNYGHASSEKDILENLLQATAEIDRFFK